MNTPIPIAKKFDYPKLTATTFPTGGRVYNTPNGLKVPSVTTILSILPKEGLDRWRERLGDQEADRISNESCRIGTTMHDRLEGYVSNYIQGRPNISPASSEDRFAYTMADNIKRYCLLDLEEVWGIEEALYCQDLYAGRTDLIGIYRGKTAIIDYKSSRRWKKDDWLLGYKMQIAAYNLCHRSMFGQDMETGVIFIAIRPDCLDYKRKPKIQYVVLKKDELKHYENEWVDLVAKYYDRGGIALGK